MTSNLRARTASSIFLILSLMLVVPAVAQAAKTIRWKLAKGDTLQVEMTQIMKQTMTIGDKTIEIPNTMKMWMTWNVEDVDADGIIKVVQEISRITMDMQAPGAGEVKFDTDSKDEATGLAKTIADMMKPMVGAKFTQSMNNQGKIIELKVPKEALQGLAANPLMKQFFSDDSFKDMMSKASPVLPEEAIEPGHIWKSETSNKTPVGTMVLAAEYTYGGEVKQDNKTLDKFSAKVNLSFGEAEGPLGASIKIIKQDNSGTMFFDSEGGYFSKTEMKQNIDMEVTVGENKLNQNIQTTVSLNVKPVKAKPAAE